MRPDRVRGAAEGMGDHGPVTRALVDDGWMTPDLLCGMTVFLLASQPPEPAPTRTDRPPGAMPSTREKASPIAGGVWVREQFTMHRPLTIDDRFMVAGASTGRFVRKGRRYGTTRSQTHDSAGHLVATNLTNGLLAYQVEPGVPDGVEGLALEDTPGPEPDWVAAVANPHLAAIAASTQGTRYGGEELVLSLAMMAARDTANPDNPIHSDPDAARAAGLTRPIAGGSHVLAFAIEPLLATWGPHALFHGSRLDIGWKAPTEADATIVPSATVTTVAPNRVDVDLEVVLAESGATAVVGTLTVPLPA
jgi:acyl dehydratase